MGLVTCAKCKNIYDYEKHYGICPKCARYNKETTAAQDHQEYHNKYDGGYSHTARDDHYSYHQRYDSNTNPHAGQLEVERTHAGNTDKKTKFILGIIIVIVAISLLPFLGFLMFPILLGVLAYVVNKKKK